jgi:hypothetical protein
MEEQKQDISIKRAFFGSFLTPQALFMLGAGLVSIVLFIDRLKRSTKEVEVISVKLEDKVSSHRFEDLEEKVNRYHTTQTEMNEKTNEEVEEVKDWIEFQKGYKQALDDIKNDAKTKSSQ